MSDATTQPARHADIFGHWTSQLPRSQWLLPGLAALLVLTVRCLSAPGVDVSALLTWAERLVDGGRPFVDFVEVNPPGSIMLYVPAVVLGRGLGISAEIATQGLVLCLLGLSLRICWSILKPARTLEDHDRPTLLAAAIVILGAMPAVAFAQREHVGVIALLPLLCVAIAEMEELRPAFALRLVAGLLAGVAMVAKPHFALLLAGAMIHLLVVTRRIRLAVEIQWIAAAAVLAAYFAFTMSAYPEFYSTALPRIADVYLGWRLGIDRMVINPVLPIIGIAAMFLHRSHVSRQISAATKLTATAGLIALAIFFVQGRGWPYHALPALIAAALAVAIEATRYEPEIPGSLRQSMLVSAAAIVLVTFGWCLKDHDRNLDALAAAVTQTHTRPSILAIAEDISIGHPLVRRVDGKWAHRVTHLWTAGGVIRQLNGSTPPSAERRSRLLAHLQTEVGELARSIEHQRPDIILAHTGFAERREFNWLAWANDQPLIARQLANYVSAGRLEDVEILQRRK